MSAPFRPARLRAVAFIAMSAVCAAPVRAAPPAAEHPAPAAAARSDPESARVVSEAEAWRVGWPMLAGPQGNFLPLRTGTPLVDDLLQARLLWESEDSDLGSAKTGSQTFRSASDTNARLGPDATVHPGNWAGVIVAEGKVFAASFRPAGPWCKATHDDGQPCRFRLDAEDVVLAIDADTGKTLWKAVSPGGLVQAGGKRGGFQVAPAYHAGRVFSMGSTGRLFAHDARDGKPCWQSDIGLAHLEAVRQRDTLLAAAAAGRWVAPRGPGWHTSLVVADGVLIAPTFRSPPRSRDIGLIGLDTRTGQRLWEVEGVISRWATPSVWRHASREFLLTASLDGALRLIDPRNGRELWKVTGLGPHYFTLSPSETHVLVNVAPADPATKRTPGRLGAYRLGLAGAERAWTLPDRPEYAISTWFDNCARQRSLIRDGIVYVGTVGAESAPGRFLLVDEHNGRILREHVNQGPDWDRIEELFYLVEDRLLVRSDASHGPRHGGRHPFFQWIATPERIARLDDDGRPCGLDLVDFVTAYEVLMETPIVAGWMFERTARGTVACYDLRRHATGGTWSLDLRGGYVGLPHLPVRLWLRPDGDVEAGKSLPPSDAETAIPFGMARRAAHWQRAVNLDALRSGDRLDGTIVLGFGTHRWPVRLELRHAPDGIRGTWTRHVERLPRTMTVRGKVAGRGPESQRWFPTPWSKSNPWMSFGDNPRGTVSFALVLEEAIPLGEKPTNLTIGLDHDGVRFTRAAGAAFGFNQAWHEVDASALRWESGRIRGRAVVVLNPDWWVTPNPATGRGIAGTIDLDVECRGSEASGRYDAIWGAEWTVSGDVTGSESPSATKSLLPPASSGATNRRGARSPRACLVPRGRRARRRRVTRATGRVS